MKTISSLPFGAAVSAAILLLASCAKTDTVQSVAQNTAASAKDVAADVKAAAAESWDNFKDYTFEKRADFSAGLDRMADKRDADLAALNAKVTGLPDDAAKARDQAVKEYHTARAALKTQLADLRAGTADTWDTAKGKISEGWQRVETAYNKVKSSSKS